MLACSSLACDADLETKCRDGACTGGTSGTSGIGGSGGAVPCEFDDTHGMPCAPYVVIRNVCQGCHIEGGIGPFVLVDYCDVYAPYGAPNPETGVQKYRWERMRDVIKPDAFPRMPFGDPDPLPDDQMAALNDWFATCDEGACAGADGQPGPGLEGCAAGGGGMGGAGGTGGAGGAGGN